MSETVKFFLSYNHKFSTVFCVLCALILQKWQSMLHCKTGALQLTVSFFCLQAARVRVPGRSPFIFKGQTNERINQTNSNTNYSSEVERVKDEKTIPESSHRRRAVIGFEIPVTRALIRS